MGALLTRVEAAVGSLGAAAFQNLCDAYLSRRYPGDWFSIGRVLGTDQTRKGRPDTLLIADGKFSFAEATTQQDRLLAKLTDDLKKALAIAVDLEPGRVTRIALCFSGQLHADEADVLHSISRPAGTDLVLVGPHRLAHDLLFRFPSVVREYLGFDVGAGQVLSPPDFVKLQGGLRTQAGLDTAFIGREAELRELVEGIASPGIVVLVGASGVGKTRLALEGIRQACEAQPESMPLCIRSRGVDVLTELMSALEPPGRYLLLLDDANRLTNLRGLLDAACAEQHGRSVTVVVTVRDYAADNALAVIGERGDFRQITVGQMPDEKIQELLEMSLGIKNHLYRERIVAIARGNSRLAVMAAQLALRKQNLNAIRDATELYEAFFRVIEGDVKVLSDPDVQRVLCVTVLFGNYHIDRTEDASLAAKLHGLAPERVQALLETLHDVELVDLYENQIARVPDQSLAAWVALEALVRRQRVDLASAIETLFRVRRAPLLDVVGGLSRTFPQPEVIGALRTAIETVWSRAEQSWTPPEILEYAHTFADVRPARALELALAHLEGQPTESAPTEEWPTEISRQHSIHDTATQILGRFRHDDGLRAAAIRQLVKEYSKRPREAGAIARELWESYGYTRYWDRGDLASEFDLFRIVQEDMQGGTNVSATCVFLALALEALKTEQEQIESRHRAIQIYRFKLLPVPQLLALRSLILTGIVQLLDNADFRPRAIRALVRYAKAPRMDGADLIHADLKVLETPLLARLNPANLHDLHLVRSLHDLRLSLGLGTPPAYVPYVTTRHSRIADIALVDRRQLRHGWRRAHAKRETRIKALARRQGPSELGLVVTALADLIALHADHEVYQIRLAVGILLSELASAPKEQLAAVLAVALGRPELAVQPRPMLDHFLAAHGPDSAREMLQVVPLAARDEWLRDWLLVLPPEQWTAAEADSCIRLVREGPPVVLHRMPVLIDRASANDDAMAEAMTIDLVARTEADRQAARMVATDLYDRELLDRPFGKILLRRPDLFERLYFATERSEQYTDYQATLFDALLSCAPGFGERWVRASQSDRDRLGRTHRDYTAIWARHDWMDVLRPVVEAALATPEPLVENSVLSSLFHTEHASAETPTRKLALLSDMVSAHQNDADGLERLFELASHVLDVDGRRELIRVYLGLTPPVDTFQRIPLISRGWSWSGSEVPSLTARREFLVSLLSLFQGLAQLPHRRVVEDDIAALNAQIVRARRDDFLER